MEELPPEWQAYARLQHSLSSRNTVDQRAWGLEAGLDSVLCGVETQSCELGDSTRKIAAGKARERHRAKLLAEYAGEFEATVNPTSHLEQRDLVRRGAQKLGSADLRLVVNIAAGYSPDELVENLNASASTLRKRLQRIREVMKPLMAA